MTPQGRKQPRWPLTKKNASVLCHDGSFGLGICGPGQLKLTLLRTGDVVHFKSNWENRGVPSMNTDKDKTPASMQRIADLLAKEKAQLWINYDKAQRDSLKMAPAYYD